MNLLGTLHQSLETVYLGTPEEDGVEASNRLSLPRARRVLLILEDYDAIRALLSNHFRTRGFDVFSAASAEDAVQIAQDEKPDIAIIDYDLGGSTALDATRQLRAAVPESTILLIGGPDTPEVAVQVKLAGANELLARAYRLGELDAIVERRVTSTVAAVSH